MRPASQVDPPEVENDIISRHDWNHLADLLQSEETDEYVAKLRELCHHNVPLFNSLVLNLQHLDHIHEVRQEVEDTAMQMITLPRGHGKSSTLVIGTLIHHLCYSTVEGSPYQDPEMLLIQESTDEVKDTIRGIQNVLRGGGPNNMIKAMFGDFEEKATKWTERRIWISEGDSVSKEPSLKTAGMKTGITGKHPRFLFADDVVSKENSKTSKLRKRSWDWWSSTVQDMTDSAELVRVIYTPYYEDDLNARLRDTGWYRPVERPALNREPSQADYEVVEEKGEIVEVELTEQGEDLEALWPCPLGKHECDIGNWKGRNSHQDKVGAHRSVKYLIKRYVGDPISFSAQQMLEVIADEETLLDKSMIRFYAFEGDSRIGETTTVNDHEIIKFPGVDHIVTFGHGWDHAIGAGKENDQTVHASAYRDDENRIFFQFYAGRWSPTKVPEKIDSRYRNDPIMGDTGRTPRQIRTETINFQAAIFEQTDEQSLEILPLEEVKDPKDKQAELVESGLPSAMQRGRVFFHVDDQEAIKEFLKFTGMDGAKDDHVDAGRMAWQTVKGEVSKDAQVARSSERKRMSRRRIKGMNKRYGTRR